MTVERIALSHSGLVYAGLYGCLGCICCLSTQNRRTGWMLSLVHATSVCTIA